jgi:preprotein translocase subunit Sec63
LMAFGYITMLVVVPLWAGAWWNSSQSRTAEGLQISTAHRFFVTAAQKSDMDIYEVARMISRCQEIVDVVDKYRQKNSNLDILKLAQLYLTLPIWKDISAEDYIPVHSCILLITVSRYRRDAAVCPCQLPLCPL